MKIDLFGEICEFCWVAGQHRQYMHFDSLSLSYTFCCQYILYPDHCVIHSSAVQQRRRSESMMRSSVVIVVISIILYIGTYAFWNNVNRNGVRTSACRSKGPRTPSSSLALRLPHIHGNLPPTLPKKWLCWRLPEASSTWHIKEEIPSSTSSTTWDKLLLWATQLPSSVTSSGHSDGNFTFCTEVAMFSVLYPLCDYLLGLLFNPWKSCSFTRHPTN